MATQKSRLAYEIIANNKASGEFKKVAGDIDNVENKSQSLSSSFNGLALAGGAAAAAIVAGFTKAVSAAADFQDQMSDISTLLGSDYKQVIGETSEGVRSLAKEYGIMHSELAGTAGTYGIFSAGAEDSAQALETLEASAQLSIAGLGSLGESADVVTSALNAFADQGLTASQVAAVLNTTVGEGKTTVSELARGFGATAPLVAQMGINWESYGAALAAATTVGKKSSIVQSEIRAAMSGLIRESEESIALYEHMSEVTGVNITTFKDLVDYMDGDMQRAFQAIYDSYDGNEAQIQKLVGSIEGFNIMLDLSTARAGKYEEALGAMGDAQADLAEDVRRQQEDFNAQWDIAKVKLYDFGISIGEIVLPALQQILDIVQPILDWINGWSDGMKTFATIVGAGGAAFLAVVAFVGIVGVLKIAWMHAAAAATAATGGLNIVIAAVVTGIAILAGVIISNWAQIKLFALQTWERIKLGFAELGAFILRNLNNISAPLEKMFNGIVSAYNQTIGRITGKTIDFEFRMPTDQEIDAGLTAAKKQFNENMAQIDADYAEAQRKAKAGKDEAAGLQGGPPVEPQAPSEAEKAGVDFSGLKVDEKKDKKAAGGDKDGPNILIIHNILLDIARTLERIYQLDVKQSGMQKAATVGGQNFKQLGGGRAL